MFGGVVAENVTGGGARTCFWSDVVCGVLFADGGCVAGVITEDSVWMGVEITHDHGGFLVRVLRWG